MLLADMSSALSNCVVPTCPGSYTHLPPFTVCYIHAVVQQAPDSIDTRTSLNCFACSLSIIPVIINTVLLCFDRGRIPPCTCDSTKPTALYSGITFSSQPSGTASARSSITWVSSTPSTRCVFHRSKGRTAICCDAERS